VSRTLPRPWSARMPLTRINAASDFWFVPKVFAVWTRRTLFNGTGQNACLCPLRQARELWWTGCPAIRCQ
jgi:hypothetical protein